MVATLSAEAWALTRRDVPNYARADAPVHVGALRPANPVREQPPHEYAHVNPDFTDFMAALLAAAARFLAQGEDRTERA